MADDPLQPQISSYSDPVYDRLEGVVNYLGRYWWLLVAVAVISVGIGFGVRSMTASPEAASAAAFVEARGDQEALIAVVNDATITAEFRAQAALQVATAALNDGDLDSARTYLQQGAQFAADAGKNQLGLAIDASMGAVAETAGDWDEARTAYGTVLGRTSQTNEPGLNLSATLGTARVELSAAAESDDAEAALAMRQEARALLEFAIVATPDVDYGIYPLHAEAFAERSNPYGSYMKEMRGQTPAARLDPYRGAAGEIDLGAAARFMLIDLDRRYPEVTGGEPLQSSAPASGTATELPADDVEQAKAMIIEQITETVTEAVEEDAQVAEETAPAAAE